MHGDTHNCWDSWPDLKDTQLSPPSFFFKRTWTDKCEWMLLWSVKPEVRLSAHRSLPLPTLRQCLFMPSVCCHSHWGKFMVCGGDVWTSASKAYLLPPFPPSFLFLILEVSQLVLLAQILSALFFPFRFFLFALLISSPSPTSCKQDSEFGSGLGMGSRENQILGLRKGYPGGPSHGPLGFPPSPAARLQTCHLTAFLTKLGTQQTCRNLSLYHWLWVNQEQRGFQSEGFIQRPMECKVLSSSIYRTNSWESGILSTKPC